MGRLIILLMLSLPVQAQGLVVIGDSITADPNSWVRHIDRPLRIMAQSGRMIRDFSLPRDIAASSTYRTAVYYLGVNDAYADNPGWTVKRELRSQLTLLGVRGFQVHVLVPQPMEFLGGYTTVWWVLRDTCERLQWVTCHEVPIHDTIDGIHPTVEAHKTIARWAEEEVL